MKSILATIVCIATATYALAQDSLSAARDLYSSASYEEALTLLVQVRERSADRKAGARADQYRAFCLFALGRTTEASALAEQLIAEDPLLELESDASPRIAAMFTDARKRLFPAIVRTQYRSARASMERKDFAAAEPQLVKVRLLLDEAASLGVSDETLKDLTELVDGFLELTRAAASRSATAAVPAPGVVERETTPPPADLSKPREAAIYDSTSPDVRAPVVVRQAFPAVPAQLAKIVEQSHRSGILEVVIDERGSVERAVMRETVLPLYDNLVLMAARTWKYQPAVKGTTPVKYVKVIAVNVKQNAPVPPLPQ